MAVTTVATASVPFAASPSRFVRDGVAVEFALASASAAGAATDMQPSPRAGDAARVRFTITDTTTGRPLTRLHPAAWLSRRDGTSAARPRTCAEKVQELLGGSIFSKAELDLNGFQVVALNDDATLTVVDPLFGFGGTKLLAMVALPGIGADWALAVGNRSLFVTVPSAGKVAMIDTGAWKISAVIDVGGAPRRVAVQPDGHYAWIASDGAKPNDGVTVIAAERGEVAARLATGRGHHEIVFSADSRWAFVTNARERTLSVIDVRSLTVTRDIPIGCEPAAVAYSPLSAAVYLTDAAAGAIVVVDAAQPAVVARIAAEPGVSELTFAPGDRFALAAVPGRDLVLVLDAASNRIVQRASVADGPEQFAFSSDMAFVRRRGTASVGMIPLKELGRVGQPVPVAEFTGGEAAFGLRTTPAGGMAAAPGETAVVVANPTDKAIYYYMEGMAAPMGNFGNYGRQPRAVLVVDRSLREVAPGVYETTADLPAAGDYDAVFFLDAPRVTHCFDATIPPNPARAAERVATSVRLQPIAPPQLIAGVPARVSFRFDGSLAGPSPDDLTLLVVLAPGIWHARQAAAPAADGTVTIEFTPPSAGTYQFSAEAPSLGLTFSGAPVLVLEAAPPSPRTSKDPATGRVGPPGPPRKASGERAINGAPGGRALPSPTSSQPSSP